MFSPQLLFRTFWNLLRPFLLLLLLLILLLLLLHLSHRRPSFFSSPRIGNRYFPVPRRFRNRSETMEGGVIEKQQASSYTYWVRETTSDAAPRPVPRKLSKEDLTKQQASQGSCTLGSVWNQAGTWEEKNLNKWASSRIKELLISMGCMEFSNGKADIHEVSSCVGDAFLVTVWNKKRVGYTFEVTLEFKGEWLIGDERKKVKGHIDVQEFTFGELEDLQIEVRLSEAKDLTADAKTGIIKDMKSFLPAISAKLLEFEQELKDR